MSWGPEREISSFTVVPVKAKDHLENNAAGICPPVLTKSPFTGMQKLFPDFSGFYVYETAVDLDPGAFYLLEIQEVYESAEVFVNGVSVGSRVQRPCRFRIPKGIGGPNSVIRVEVATLLERKLHKEGVPLNGMTIPRPLSPAGIVGKVTLRREI